MSENETSPTTPPKRRRRTPESARREILDAAGQRLMSEGPDGLRLKSIAGDLGISHSSILHHFGSRDGLLDALSVDAIHALERDLMRSLEGPSKEDPAADLFDKISRVLGERGYARLLAWQLISGRRGGDVESMDPEGAPGDDGGLLDRLTQTVHALRLEHAKGQATSHVTPSLEDTRSIVTMTACALFGEALAGEVMMRNAAFETNLETRKKFRHWIARHVEDSVFPEVG